MKNYVKGSSAKYRKPEDYNLVSCSICGTHNNKDGMIFKGHFICDECREYIIKK